MSPRRILTVDNAADLAVLKQVSAPAPAVTKELRQLMEDMLEAMYAAPGIGLAAIQVGVAVRAIVMDLSREEGQPQPRFFVNPEITWRSEETGTYEEGCLSVPEIFDDVERPLRVGLRYMNFAGDWVEEDAEGLFAVCIQHEMDHLEGVLFLDHLSRLKRERAIKKVRKAAQLA